MASPETMSAAEQEAAMEYSYELPEEKMRYTFTHDTEGHMAALKIMAEDDTILYEHTTTDGPITEAVLRNDLKGMGLQEIAIASIVEKLS